MYLPPRTKILATAVACNTTYLEILFEVWNLQYVLLESNLFYHDLKEQMSDNT